MRYKLPYQIVKWLYCITERSREKRYQKLKSYLLPAYETPKDMVRVNQVLALVAKYRFYYLTAFQELDALRKEATRIKEENRILLDKVRKLQKPH